MIQIAISQAAFDPIAAPAVRQRQLRGEDQRQRRAVDLARCRVADRLSALRGPGESYSDVVVRLAEPVSAN
jgi:hypothetical protein